MQRSSAAPYERIPLHTLLKRSAVGFGDHIAVIDGDRRFTYSEIDILTNQLASELIAMSVKKGDRVGILAPNCVEFVIAFYGISKAGAVITTVNSGYREREIAHQLNDSGTNTLIVHRSLVAMVESARSEIPGLNRLIVIDPASDDPAGFWGLIKNSSTVPVNVEIDPENDVAVLPYSSGTTGLSKGVMLSHYNLTANVRQLVHRPGEASKPTSEDILLVHLPLFHIYGMNILMNGAIAVGATMVMMGRFDMDQFLTLLSSHRITILYTVPPVILSLTQYPAMTDHNLSSLRYGFCGAAPLSEELQLRAQDALGFPILQAYGLTETSPYCNSDYMEPGMGRVGSIGVAAPDTEEKVVDLEYGTTEVPRGEIGELLVRGPQIMKGYFNNPDATSEAISTDGWLRTGDIVRMDEDGYVWVLDRKKELIKYKGFQVPPAELEGLLLEHPAVADAAVIGIDDKEAGEVPKAFVVAKPDMQPDGDDIMEFVAGRVATFKQVRQVEFVDTIPKNPSGKILRRVLIEQERTKYA